MNAYIVPLRCAATLMYSPNSCVEHSHRFAHCCLTIIGYPKNNYSHPPWRMQKLTRFPHHKREWIIYILIKQKRALSVYGTALLFSIIFGE